jgi:hypothetical protein
MLMNLGTYSFVVCVEELIFFVFQGLLCNVDVNECAHFAGTDLGCQNGATCINKPGTYE